MNRYASPHALAQAADAPVQVCRMLFAAVGSDPYQLADMRGPDRDRDMVRLCRAVILTAKLHTNASLPAIGRALNRDHSVVHRGLEEAKTLWVTDPDFRDLCGLILRQSRCASEEPAHDRTDTRPCAREAAMYDDAVKTAICQRLIGGESLREICAGIPSPARSTVFEWLSKDDDFRSRYELARTLQAEALVHDIIEIADTPVIGRKTTTKPDGTVETVEGDMIDHRRLRVDARKWVASKLAPKKYGEATLLKHADADGNRVDRMGDEEKFVRLAAIFAEGSARASREKL